MEKKSQNVEIVLKSKLTKITNVETHVDFFRKSASAHPDRYLPRAIPVRDPGAVADEASDAMMISEFNHAETLEDALLAAILEDEDMSTM